jgi:hypothetical protein
MIEKTDPKYKIGQVVMMKSLKKPLPFLILGMIFAEGEWFYQWNKKNYAAEHMIRELQQEELGGS